MRILIVGLVVTSATTVVVADIVSRDFHQEEQLVESNQDRGYSKDNDRRYRNVEDSQRQTRLELPDNEVRRSLRTEQRDEDRRLDSRRVQSRCGTQRTLSYTIFAFCTKFWSK